MGDGLLAGVPAVGEVLGGDEGGEEHGERGDLHHREEEEDEGRVQVQLNIAHDIRQLVVGVHTAQARQGPGTYSYLVPLDATWRC